MPVVMVVPDVPDVPDVPVVMVGAVAMKCKGVCGSCVEVSMLNEDGVCVGCVAEKSEIAKKAAKAEKEMAKKVAKKAKEMAKAEKEMAKKAKSEDKKQKKADKKADKKAVVAIVVSACESSDDATVMMAPSVSPERGGGRPDVFLMNAQLNVERVEINGVSFLIDENDIAYLESSKKMVGKYDEKDHSIRQMYSNEYDEYYGASDVEDSDEDEMPV